MFFFYQELQAISESPVFCDASATMSSSCEDILCDSAHVPCSGLTCQLCNPVPVVNDQFVNLFIICIVGIFVVFIKIILLCRNTFKKLSVQ